MTWWRVAGGIAVAGVLATACAGGDASTPAAPARTFSLGGNQPIWPFAGEDEAADWQRQYRSGGHQPWRLSPDETALAFVGYLGFDEIDRVTQRTVSGGDARIGVGRSASRTAAAVIHLIRLGAGPDAPWEVVGTDDTSLSLTAPAYGATVSSPVTVGGRISGVDETIRVTARQLSTDRPVGRFCCVPAGGQGSPWSARLTIRGATDPVVTIVASTGGHVAKVERFAVTAVRVSR